MSERPITLYRSDASTASAKLHDALKREQLLVVEAQWRPKKREHRSKLDALNVARRDQPESLHWNWEGKADLLKAIEARGYAIEFESRWQGAMITRTANRTSRHSTTMGKPVVYVDYVEKAPWNHDIAILDQRAEFTGIGSILVREAVNQSVDEECEGRVALHSLSKAEGFYAKIGMEALGADPKYHDLMYFEFTKEGAKRFLDGGV